MMTCCRRAWTASYAKTRSIYKCPALTYYDPFLSCTSIAEIMPLKILIDYEYASESLLCNFKNPAGRTYVPNPLLRPVDSQKVLAGSYELAVAFETRLCTRACVVRIDFAVCSLMRRTQ
jgi:hypothetical protein